MQAKVSDGIATVAGVVFKLSYGRNSMSYLPSDDDSVDRQLKIEFNDAEGRVFDVVVLAGGKPLLRTGMSTTNRKRTWFFGKPAEEVTVVVTSGEGVKTVTLPL